MKVLDKDSYTPDDAPWAAVIDVLDERARQRDAEGFTDDHDDAHVKGELARAGLTYAMHSVVIAQLLARGMTTEEISVVSASGKPPATWPWSPAWWKPGDQRRNLVKAAALLVAEIERIDRADEQPRKDSCVDEA